MKRMDVIKMVEKVGGVGEWKVWDDSWYVKGGKTRRLKFWGLELSRDKMEELRKRLVGKKVGRYSITDVRYNSGYSFGGGDVCVMLRYFLC